MLSLEDHLTLILSRGLPSEAACFTAGGRLTAEEEASLGGGSARARQRFVRRLEVEGLLRNRPVIWPERRQVGALAACLRGIGACLAWRGSDLYPARLTARLGQSAPPWIWLAGPPERLNDLSCAIVGSRETRPQLLAAARRLAKSLAEAGVTVVSGMAAGADTAAHQGALRGSRGGNAGTIAVPAYGILNMDLGACRIQIDALVPGMTCLALDRPDAPFSAGLAIRRNSVIAALGEGLVLVASGLKGGSSYAVRWALDHRQPFWCFEAGRATPPANVHLIRQGLAQPLSLAESPEQWVHRILPALEQHATAQPSTAHEQLSLL